MNAAKQPRKNIIDWNLTVEGSQPPVISAAIRKEIKKIHQYFVLASATLTRMAHPMGMALKCDLEGDGYKLHLINLPDEQSKPSKTLRQLQRIANIYMERIARLMNNPVPALKRRLPGNMHIEGDPTSGAMVVNSKRKRAVVSYDRLSQTLNIQPIQETRESPGQDPPKKNRYLGSWIPT